MLQALTADDRDTLRRGLGLVLVAAFVLLLVAGFAHAGDADHRLGGSHDCGTCLALFQVAAALPAAAAFLVARVATRRPPVVARVAAARRVAVGRPPPARAPPFVR